MVPNKKMNKLSLIPFDPIYAEYVWMFYYDPAYSHFSRGVTRYLTKQEVLHINEVINREILIVLCDGKPCGIQTLFNDAPDSFYGGFALDVEHQKQKLLLPAAQLAEEYVFKKRAGDILKLEVLSKDVFLINALKKIGYLVVGEIKKYIKVNGVFEDMTMLYKNKRLDHV